MAEKSGLDPKAVRNLLIHLDTAVTKMAIEYEDRIMELEAKNKRLQKENSRLKAQVQALSQSRFVGGAIGMASRQNPQISGLGGEGCGSQETRPLQQR